MPRAKLSHSTASRYRIKQNLDAMAATKMNVLHLHAADFCRFSIESKVFPELTQNLTGVKAGFYTQDEFDKYKAKLDEWRTKQLAKYDDKPEWAAKKDAKHTDRAGFDAWLAAEIETNCSAVKIRD